MNELMPLEFKNQRIMLTKTLADQYGTEDVRVHQNYLRNKDRFVEGKHFYKLEGEELKRFKTDYLKDSSLKINSLILWTDRGAARHAKILDTDEAWEVYEALEENYFNPKQALNTSELSPELQMFKQIFDTVAKQQLENKYIKAEIKETKEEIQGIRDVITLDSNQWRKDTGSLINKIANKLGGSEHIKPVREETYKLLDNTYGVSLKARLLNKQKKMALEGVPKYKIDKVNFLDVITDDKKLINGYVNIVGKLAIKYGV